MGSDRWWCRHSAGTGLQLESEIMATFTKNKLSGSTDGLAIKLTGNTSGGAVTVHTAVAGTTAGIFDEIWLYANNTSTS